MSTPTAQSRNPIAPGVQPWSKPVDASKPTQPDTISRNSDKPQSGQSLIEFALIVAATGFLASVLWYMFQPTITDLLELLFPGSSWLITGSF